jgi:hypothetical protein
MAMDMSTWSGFNPTNYSTAAGLGGIGAGLYGLFGQNNNPAEAAMPYINQIPGAVAPYLQPYSQAGQQAIPTLQGQYGDLLNNPGAKLNQIGANFQQSPGFKFALQQALQGAGHAEAAGGMAGSPEHEQQNMALATNLGNQEYYNWLNPATQMYQSGLQGTQGLASGGLQAGSSVADMIAQALAQQGAYAYQGAAGQNTAQNAGIGNLFGGAATLAAFL